MDKKIADRLAQLRKDKGYSQEEAAAALFVSRQAVSKWERGESAPDTDNLIALSKLYGMPLDELLFGGKDVNNGSAFSGDFSNRNTIKDKSEYENNIGHKMNGFESSVPNTINTPDVSSFSTDDEQQEEEAAVEPEDSFYKSSKWEEMINSQKIKEKEKFFSFPLLVTIIYLLLGFGWGLWHPGWIIFLTIPLRGIKGEVSWRRYLVSPIMITIIYLLLGFYFNLWHPGWILFLCIPFFQRLA